jgi:hypothetical protein
LSVRLGGQEVTQPIQQLGYVAFMHSL